MNSSSIRRSLDTLSFCALVLYILDIILLGTGLVTKYGPISTRILFFAVAFIAAIPRMWEYRKVLIKNKYIWMICAFLLYAAIMAVYGYFAGNRVDIMVQDLKGYINLAILPVMMVMLDSKEKINKLLKFIFCGCLAVALLSFLFSFLRFFPNSIASYLMDRLTYYGITQLTFLTDRATRVFFDTGTRYMFTAFIIGLYFAASKDKPNKLVIIASGAIMASMFISYTRGIYLGALVAGITAVVLVWVTAKAYLISALKSFAVITAVCVVFISGLSLMQSENLFYIGFWRTVTGMQVDTTGWEVAENSNVESEIESLSVREMRKANAIKAIKESPVFGKGLGYAIDEKNGYIEYFYYDLWAKTGIVGVILFLLPPVVLLIEIIKKRKRVSEHTLMFHSLMFASAVFVFVISYFNPCMNSTVGLSIFSLSITAISPANRWDIRPVQSGE